MKTILDILRAVGNEARTCLVSRRLLWEYDVAVGLLDEGWHVDDEVLPDDEEEEGEVR